MILACRSRPVPTFEKLDRILVSVDWENKFPISTVHALPRAGSDHTPLLLDFGEQAHRGNKATFSFELSWLSLGGFREIVAHEWAAISDGSTPIEREWAAK